MWYRASSLLLGLWLLMSPLALTDSQINPTRLWWLEPLCGVVIIELAAMSAWEQDRRILPLLLASIGIGLIAAAYLNFAHPTPAAQNRACSGLLLLMLALVPLADERNWTRSTSRSRGFWRTVLLAESWRQAGPVAARTRRHSARRHGSYRIRDAWQCGHRAWDSRL